MATSTSNTFLMYNNGSAMVKLIDIKDFPDMGGEPEKIDTTTLSDTTKTSIPGIQDVDTYQFTTNYSKNDYNTIKELEGNTQSFAVYFGTNGADGMCAFSGQVSVWITGGGINDVREMKLAISPSTAVTVS